jgi:acyl-CoA thioesterase-1
MKSCRGRFGVPGFLSSLAAIFIFTSAPAGAATIVALGASNTYGKGVARNQAYPAQLEAILRAKGANVRVINAGINGDTTEGMLQRLDRTVPQGLAGSNVGNSGPAEGPGHPGDHDRQWHLQGIAASARRPAPDAGRLPHARRAGGVPSCWSDRSLGRVFKKAMPASEGRAEMF